MKRKKDPNRYPKGWNARSIKKLIDHYEKQTEEAAAAEDEAAYRSTRLTMMAVPVEAVSALMGGKLVSCPSCRCIPMEPCMLLATFANWGGGASSVR